MRPVPTWKSTAAAPTPISEGPSCGSFGIHAVAGGAVGDEELVALLRCHLRCSRGGRLGLVDAAGGHVQASGDEQSHQQQCDGGERMASPLRKSLHLLVPHLCVLERGELPHVGNVKQVALLQEVDDHEQGDPHDVDEVPVVRHHDRTGCLVVAELACNEARPMISRKAMSPPVTCRPWKPVVM